MADDTPPEPQPPPPGGTAERDEVYYWDTARFLIDGVVFKLPRYQFTIGSPFFAKTYLQGVADVTPKCQTPAELVDVFRGVGDGDDDAWDSVDVTEGGLGTATGKGAKARSSVGLDEGDNTRTITTTTTSGAVPIEGVTADQFRTFLKLLFPIYSTSTTTTLSKQEWLTILTLSTRWHFAEPRKLAIEALQPHMSFASPPSNAELAWGLDLASCSTPSADLPDPVDMITLGRAAFVPRWVEDGYERLVTKEGAISEEECRRVGWRTGVKLYIVRHGLDQAHGDIDAEGQDGGVRRLVQEAFEEELSNLKMEERARRTKGEVRIEEDEERERERKRAEEEEGKRLKEEGERRAREEEEKRVKREEEEQRRKEQEEEDRRLKEERERRAREEEEEAHRLKEEGKRVAKEEEERLLKEEEEKRRKEEEKKEAAKAKKAHKKRAKREEKEAQKLKKKQREANEENDRASKGQVKGEENKEGTTDGEVARRTVEGKAEEVRPRHVSLTHDGEVDADRPGATEKNYAAESDAAQIGEREDKERERRHAEEQVAAERRRREAEREASIQRKLEEELAKLIADTAADQKRREEEEAAKKERKRQAAAEARREREAAELATPAQTCQGRERRSLIGDIVGGIGRVLPQSQPPVGASQVSLWEASFKTPFQGPVRARLSTRP